MKNTLKLLGVIALAVVIGFSMAGCGDGSNDGDGGNDNITGTVVPGDTLALKLTWLKSNAESDTTYLLKVSADEELSSQTLSYSDKSNITINLEGSGKTISLLNKGSLFRVGSNIDADTVTLALYNITLQGNADNGSSALVNVGKSGTLVMNNGAKITGNTANDTVTGTTGGGVYVNSGSFVMNGGEISGNAASSLFSGGGGGVYVSSGSFVMNDGKITGNTAGDHGGGVYINGSFVMNGGKITGNTATNGGGVSVLGDGSIFTMNEGEISDNTSTYGGGVHMNHNVTYTVASKFEMKGGKITGNTATSTGTITGGGLCLQGESTFSHEGGDISGNSPDDVYPSE